MILKFTHYQVAVATIRVAIICDLSCPSSDPSRRFYPFGSVHAGFCKAVQCEIQGVSRVKPDQALLDLPWGKPDLAVQGRTRFFIELAQEFNPRLSALIFLVAVYTNGKPTNGGAATPGKS